MTIYTSFIPCRLYIKELAGVKYFGKTSKYNIYSYTGSGKVWKDRIKKYGKNNIKTLWVSDWYYDPNEIMEVALHFSRENNIVESKEWANLKEENGLDGGDPGPEACEKISNSKSGKPLNFPVWNKGKTGIKTSNKGQIAWNKGLKTGHKSFTGKKHSLNSIEKMKEKHANRQKLVCEYCDRMIDKPNFTRYHGDKCKKKILS